MAPEHLFYIFLFFAFALGAVVGSFLNVVIYRVPAGLSIVTPGSRCPECESPIRWYDNIPIISWFILGGKCRQCDCSIPGRYALVEALMGFLSAMLWVKIAGPHFRSIGGTLGFNQPPPVPDVHSLPWGSIAIAFGFYFFFLAILVVITFVDIDHYLIPHEFTLPAMAIGVFAAFMLNNSSVMADGSMAGFWPPVTLSGSIIGLLVGGVSVVLIFYVYFAARGIEGVGGGDVTLMAVMGAWLGWPALIFIFFAASIQGLIAAGVGALVGADFLKDSREILNEEDPRVLARAAREASEASTAETEHELTGIDEQQISVDGTVSNPDEEVVNKEVDEEVVDEEVGEEVVDNIVIDKEIATEDDALEIVVDDDEMSGGLAVPFGPFIALAGVQYFFLGEVMPPAFSMIYFYPGF